MFRRSYPAVARFCFFLIAGTALMLCAGVSQPESYNEEWRWVQFTTQSGLPSNEVYDVVETSDGVNWAVTSAGLAWYDGFEWKPLDNTQPSFRRRPEWIEPGENGNLYVIYGEQLFRATASGLLPESLAANMGDTKIGGIFPDGQGGLIVYSGDGKVHRVFQHQISELPVPVPMLQTRSLHTRLGEIWLISASGLFKWAGDQLMPKLTGIPGFKIQCICENERGYALVSAVAPLEARGIWECTSAGDMLKRDTSMGEAVFVAADISPNGDVVALLESGDVRIRSESKWSALTFPPPQLRHATFFRFTRKGDLWVGSEAGLYFCNKSSRRWTYWKHPQSALENVVLEICRAHDGSILLGTGDGLEVHYPDGHTRLVREIDGKRIAALTGLCEDSDGNIWISSGGYFEGAYRWDGKRWKHFGPREGLGAERIHKIRKDIEGRLWFLGLAVNSDEGPGAFEYSHGSFTRWGVKEGLLSGRVYSFAESADSALWFGTLKGMCRWKKGIWKNWVSAFPQPQRVFALIADKSNGIWFSGPRVLGLIDKDDQVHTIPLADEHITADVWDLALDQKERLWISTRDPARIFCYSRGSWVSLTQHSGLNNLNPWPLFLSGDQLYVGTDGSGVNILNMNDAEAQPPRVVIEQPSVDGSLASIRLKAFPYWGEQPMQDVKIRYRVDNGSWSDWVLRREVKLADVAVGSHEFNVQAKGLFGKIDSTGRGVTFAVAPPLYRRPAVALPIASLSIAVLVLGVSSLIRKRKHDAMLRHSESKFRRLTEAAFEGIAFYDDNGIILDANKSIVNMFGYPETEFIGESMITFFAPESRETLRLHMFSDDEQSYQAVGVQKDGTKIILEIIGKTIPYENKTTRVVAVRDITERRYAEEQLLAYQAKLQSLASELSLMEERERRRMATYLHDYIGQALAMCRLKLGSPGDAISVTEINEIRKYVEQATQHTQSLTFDLSPPILYELSFEDAIEWLTEQMFHEHHLPIYFHNDKNAKPLDRDLKITLYNSIRELLINIVKHAQAASAKVSLHRTGETMTAIIQDDGKGFDAGKINTHILSNGSFGLFNIRERLSYLGGNAIIHSELGLGTKITLTAPLQAIKKPGKKESA